jgi:hypothetical protein
VGGNARWIWIFYGISAGAGYYLIMSYQRRRAVIWAAASLVGIWLVALGGYWVAANAKMTADKVRAYMGSVDFASLSAADRAKAIQALADKLNRLSRDERRELWLDHTLDQWFSEMTEDEKGAFIDATMPTGFKQMLSAFEDMPADRRKKMVDDSLKHLREQRDEMASDDKSKKPDSQSKTNRPPPLSPELEAKVREIGLKTFYSDSTPETNAELAPVLEELQQNMESGAAFHNGGR